MKKLYFLLIASFLGLTLVGQETITLHWQIIDDHNEPLVGVSILKKQTTEGTVTDENGMFSIDVVPGRDELEISYLGYQTSNLIIRNGMKLKGKEMLFPAEYELPEVKVALNMTETHSRASLRSQILLSNPALIDTSPKQGFSK